MRVDRWLWCARFFKTRTQAAAAISKGSVRLGGERIKAGRQIGVGDVLRVDRGADVVDLEVLGLPSRRGPAAEAEGFFEESLESIARREKRATDRTADSRLRPPTAGRPDKRTRRLLRTQRRGSSVLDE